MKRRALLSSIPFLPAFGSSSFSNLHAMPFLKNINETAKFKHSACRWCYNSIPLEEFCEKGKALGLKAIDLLSPDETVIAQKYGLASSMIMSQPDKFGIPHGFNRIENHEVLVPFYEKLIVRAAELNVKNVICFSGNRDGLSDVQGIGNCAIGLRKLMPLAEKLGVIICMELLNSKIDHHDYQCDKTDWGVSLVKAVGSANFRLLYDIYHMQIMEGDVIRNIKDNHQYFAHYHTGGVPGRHEIDETQELFYPAIIKAIVETGYDGYIAQEFIPANTNKLASLERALKICTV